MVTRATKGDAVKVFAAIVRCMLVVSVGCGFLLLGEVLAPGQVGASASACDRIASPGGSDGNAGSETAPFRTAQKLVDSLSAGQTGCLRAGTYAGAGPLIFARGGQAGAPLTLTSYPDERATLRYGTVHVTSSAPYVSVGYLNIDGSSDPDEAMRVEGEGAVIAGNIVTNANAGASCLVIAGGAKVDVRSNRFHRCGSYGPDYVGHAIRAARTDGTTITNNVFWNASRSAIHLYPDARRTSISHNVIDGNGRGITFGGDATHASSDATVEHNIISNSTTGYLLQSYLGGLVGTGNVARSNCLWRGELGDIGPQIGFTATGNVTADPLYVDRARHDYRLAPGSPCLDVVGYDTAAKIAVGCDRVASSAGSDSNPGTEVRPFRTPQKLVESLSAGQTGCLREGTYSSTDRLVFSSGGQATAPLTLTSYPGERATLRHDVVRLTSSAPYVTLSNLTIDGSANPDVTIWVEGDNAVLRGNDISNANAGKSCLFIGNDATVTIRENRFHDCGGYAHGNQDHGIYAEHTVGTKITDNLFWNISGYVIHLYPDAQQTSITHNVIDDNGYGGVIFGGGTASASNSNTVEQNIISNVTIGYLVKSYWGGPVGTGNVARSNCLWHGKLGDIGPQVGFTTIGNLTADPLYVNRANRDYRLAPASPCLAVVGYDTAAKLAGTT